MRACTCDSPQAAACFVALSLLADGHLGTDKLKALYRARLPDRLGLAKGEFETIMQELCADLISSPHLNWRNLCQPGSEVMQQLITEIKDPHIRSEFIDLCKISMRGDHHISENWFDVLHVFSEACRLSSQMDVVA